MKSSTKYLKILFNYLFAIILAVVLIFVLPRLLAFFWPFVVAALIAAIANPLVRFLENKMKIRRKAGSVFVMILTLAAVVGASYGILYVLISELVGFFTNAPNMWAKVNSSISNLSSAFSTRFALLPRSSREFFSNLGESIYEELQKVGTSIGESAAQSASDGVKNAPQFLIGVITISVY